MTERQFGIRDRARRAELEVAYRQRDRARQRRAAALRDLARADADIVQHEERIDRVHAARARLRKAHARDLGGQATGGAG